MTPYGGLDDWQVLAGLIIMTAVVCVAGTWIISILTLHIYRARVRRNMVLGRPVAISHAPAGSTSAGPPGVIIRPAAVAPGGPLEVRARRSSRRAQLLLVTAAALYGLCGVVVTSALDDLEVKPFRTVVLVLLYAWPIVPTLIAQLADQRPIRVASVWVAYVLLLQAAAWIGGLHSVSQLLLLLALEVGIPAIVVAATSVRTVRGVSWMVAPGLLLLSLALWMGQWPARYLFAGLSFDRIAYAYLAAAIICLTVLGLYCLGLLAAYRRKWLSDQSLLILQWWFVVTFWHVIDLVSAHGWAGLLALIPMVLASVLIMVGWRLNVPETGPSRRLLLLRTFGARSRSTRLLRDLTRRWRWIGSIDLVTAPDVASEVLSPVEFVDFLRGRLSHQFIDGPDALARRLDEVDLQPDAEGRYRLNRFLCHVDDWKPLLEVLVTSADVVVIDVRGSVADISGSSTSWGGW